MARAKSGTYVLKPQNRSRAQRQQVREDQRHRKAVGRRKAMLHQRAMQRRQNAARTGHSAFYKPVQPKRQQGRKVRLKTVPGPLKPGLQQSKRIVTTQLRSMGLGPEHFGTDAYYRSLSRATRSKDPYKQIAAIQLAYASDEIEKERAKYQRTRTQSAVPIKGSEVKRRLNLEMQRRNVLAAGSPVLVPAGAAKLGGKVVSSLAGAAEGYASDPREALSGDARAAKEIAKGLVSGAAFSAIAHPRQTAEDTANDYQRRYSGGRAGAKNIVRNEGGLSYLLDALTIGAVAGKAAGAVGKAKGAIRTGERPKLRISQGVVREQADEAAKVAPNIFRVAAQRSIDRHRTKAFAKLEKRAEQTGDNVKIALRPGKGEVVRSRRGSVQKRDVARVKGHHMLNMKREQGEALREVDRLISSRPGKGLNRHEKLALSYVYEGTLPNDPVKAVPFIERRVREIVEARRNSARGNPTKFQKDADELRVLRKLLESPDEAFTPRVTEAAEILRKIDEKAAAGSAALPHSRRMSILYGPQAEVLGVSRGVRKVEAYDEQASRKAATRRGIDYDAAQARRATDRRVKPSETTRTEPLHEFVRRVIAKREGHEVQPLSEADQRRIVHLRRLADPRSGATPGERAAATNALRRIQGKTAVKRDPTGLGRPGYVPHTSKAGDVEPSNYTTGGPAARDYKRRTMENFREGRVDRRPEAIREGIAKTIKIKHNHRVVAEQFQRHANRRYSGVTLSEAVQRMDADGIDPGQVRIWFPGKFKQTAAKNHGGVNTNDLDHPIGTLHDDVKSSAVELHSGRAGLNQMKRMAADPKFKDQKAVVVDKAVYDEIMSSTKPSGAVGRTVDVINAKAARAILGTGNVTWMAMDGLSGAIANAVGGVVPLGPTWWKAQVWYKKLPEDLKRTLDNELGISPRIDYVNQPHIGASVENMPAAARGLVKGWQAWRQTPIGKLRPIGKPIDLFMRAENKIAVEPFRKAQGYKEASKLARQQERMDHNIGLLNEGMDRLVSYLKLDPKQRIEKFLKDPRAAEQVGRAVDELLGDWTTKTNAERKVLGRVGFFYPYMRYSMRMLFYTLPTKHPIALSIAAKLGQLGTEQVKELMGGEDVPWGLGKIYYEKDGKLMEFSLAKRANFLSNAVVGAERSENLTGVLPPIVGMALSQVLKQNVYTGESWTTDGNPSWNDANTNIWHRAQIAAAQLLGLPFATRIAGNVLSSGQKQSSDSLPLVGSEKPLKYSRADKLQEQRERLTEKQQTALINQIVQAMGLAPKPSKDRKIALKKKQERYGGASSASPKSGYDLQKATGVSAGVSGFDLQKLAP